MSLPVPIAGVAEIAFDTVQIGMDPGCISGLFILNDLVRLVPTAFRRPPQRGKRRIELGLGRGCCARETGFEIGHAHHHLGGVKRPAACSITSPSENSVSSSNGRPISCRPSGNPCESFPAGTAMPGSPAMFTVTVKMSLRYISMGSAPDRK